MDQEDRELTDADLAYLKGALADLNRRVSEVNDVASRTLRQLDELNSSFPATREFLDARGVQLVSELDSSGREALIAHLQKTLQVVLAENKAAKGPSNGIVH